MKDILNKITTDITGKINEMLVSLSVSFTLVIISYVIISKMGIFSPLDNEMALELFSCCFVIAIVHQLMNLLDIKMLVIGVLCKFSGVVAVVLFMGIAVYHWFFMDVTFFVSLAVMLILVFFGTLFIAYLDVVKKVYEINQMIKKSRENRKDKK